MKTWGQYKPGDLVRIVCAENRIVTLCVIQDLGNTVECCRPDLYEAYKIWTQPWDWVQENTHCRRSRDRARSRQVSTRHDARITFYGDFNGYVRYEDRLFTVDEIYRRLEDQGLDRDFISQWIFSLPVERA